MKGMRHLTLARTLVVLSALALPALAQDKKGDLWETR